MKKLFVLTLILLSFDYGYSQTRITLDECYSKAYANYPLIKQKEYVMQSKDYNVSNVWKGYLPQITINGQATYQSDVTSLPISLPGIKIESLTKDQYKAYADVSQVIYDGGMMSSQADIQKSLAKVDDQKLETELLKVKESVNQIYFGILSLDQQLKQIELIKNDLNESLSKLNASFENGIATKTNVDILKAEVLNTEQRFIELMSSRKAYLNMLSLFINSRLDDSTTFAIPPAENITSQSEINRPELKMFSYQRDMLENQRGLTIAKILPKASLFFQGGYGKPTLDMLKNDFDWYYIAGARLTWSLSNLYTQSNENELNELNKYIIDSQKETFLLNTNIAVEQQLIEINKLKELINVDKEIIDLRTSIKEAVRSQLENGVVTSSDYIRELNSEDRARQNLAIHTIQLLMVQYKYKLTIGY
ncbi:MAG TPA: transporter [Ignavibacteriales bacterium]|nr:transporter [Ignavibacteriales bacterium]